jgi:RNA polymerase sigma-70 factor (ECF subfamily)
MATKEAEKDARAVARCLQGDRAAFGELVRRYQALAVGLAFSVTGDRASAEDVAQEAFVRAYRSLKQLTRRQSFCAWLMHIVKNAALRAAHNAARRREVHEAASVDQGPHTENPTASLELAEMIGQVDGASREVLVLKYVQGMTCAEVADRLDLPIGTVTSKISRALSVLRRRAAREEP